MDLVACGACDEVLFDGSGEAPAGLTALGDGRTPCPVCGSRVRKGTFLAEVVSRHTVEARVTARPGLGVDRLVAGFVAAHERLVLAASSNRPGDFVHPLYECLNYAVFADDQLRHEATARREADWVEALSSEDQALVRATRCARNVVHHAWESLIEATWKDGASNPVWRWKAIGRASLTPRGRLRRGAREYAAVLEAEDVMGSLGSLQRVLLAQVSHPAAIDAGGTSVGRPPS